MEVQGEDRSRPSTRSPKPDPLRAAELRRLKAETELTEAQTLRTLREAENLAEDAKCRPEEMRALRLQNVMTVLRILGVSMALLVLVGLILAHIPAGVTDPPTETDHLLGQVWMWLLRLLSALMV